MPPECVCARRMKRENETGTQLVCETPMLAFTPMLAENFDNVWLLVLGLPVGLTIIAALSLFPSAVVVIGRTSLPRHRHATAGGFAEKTCFPKLMYVPCTYDLYPWRQT